MLDTNAAVERINKVQDSDGEDTTPANEDRQQAIRGPSGPSGATTRPTRPAERPPTLPDLAIPDEMPAPSSTCRPAETSSSATQTTSLSR
ncbi:hypothetical protein C9J85_03080 [Haloferax sp. wsp5]|nr:hypothetical protein C9J85_03080 [Haloferax sp. wsp5]